MYELEIYQLKNKTRKFIELFNLKRSSQLDFHFIFTIFELKTTQILNRLCKF